MAYIGTSPTQAVRTRFLYTATASQTTFSGADTQNLTLRYSDANFVDVYQNGVLLKGGGADYTATTTTSVVLSTGATADDVIEIIVYDVFAVANLIKKDGDTVEGVINFNGKEITLDADFDTSITADTDDQIDIKIAGSDSLRIKANEIENVSGDFTLDVAGDIILDADDGIVAFRDGGVGHLQISNSSNDAVLTSLQNDKDLIIQGNDNGSIIEAARFDMSVGGFLGLGTTSPSSRLNIVGDAFTKSTIRLERTGGGTDNDAGLQFKAAAGANDDTAMGGIWFQNAEDDNAYALIRARTDDSTGTSGRLDFITSESAVGNSTTPRMTIKSDGKVGVNATSPLSTFQVRNAGSENGSLRVGGSGASLGLELLYDQSGATESIIQANPTYTSTSSLLKIRVDGDGNPSQLVMSGGGNVSLTTTSTGGGSILTLSTGSFTHGIKQFCNNGQKSLHVEVGGSEVGSISHSTSSTAFNTSSDYRLKENVITDWDATSRLKQLKPSRFNFKVEKDTTVDGFLAHEVSSIVPEAITGEKDGTQDLGDIKDKDGNVINKDVLETETKKDEGQTWTKTKTENVYQGIDQSKLVPLLTKALQEALARIETLEAEVKTLKGK